MTDRPTLTDRPHIGGMTLGRAQVSLEPIWLAATERVPETVIRHAKLETWVDPVIGGLVAQVRALVAGRVYEDDPIDEVRTVTFETPASWWQAFKVAAVDAGNPFFDPDKVVYRVERRTVRIRVTPRHAVIVPDVELPVLIPGERHIRLSYPALVEDL